MKSKAVFFDLDGTLLNTLGDLTDACNYALNKHNIYVSLDDVKLAIGSGIKNMIINLMPKSTSEELIEEALNDFKNYYSVNLDVKTYPYDGVIELLKELKTKGYKIAIVSNKFQKGVDILFEKFFKGLVDVALGIEKNRPIKPNPQIVDDALKILNIEKEDVLYVGDSGADVETAFNANLKMLTVTYGYRTREQLNEVAKRLKIELVFIDDIREVANFNF